MGVELAPSCQAWAWETKEEFINEAGLITSWYKTCRKAYRRRMGILRSRNLGPRIECQNCVMTREVDHHYTKLLDPVRLQGLWNWREIAEALRGAGIGMQTGTVPVERLWSGLKGMFPPETRRMSLSWFDLLAKLAYFRYNYRHFHCKTSPVWTEEDSLLAERLGDIRASLFPDAGCGPDAPAPLA